MTMRAVTTLAASFLVATRILSGCGGGAAEPTPKDPLVVAKIPAPCAETNPPLDETNTFGKTVTAICIQGAPAKAFEDKLGLKVGDALTEASLRKAILNVHAIADDATAFARKSGDGVALTFVVHERPRLRRLGFEGASSATIAPGHATLVHAGEIFDPVKAQEDAEAIRAVYLEAGFDEATVTPKATPAGEGLVDLQFVVVEGKRAIVGPVTFPGAQKAFEPQLLEASGLLRGAPLSTEKLDKVPLLVAAFYNDRGYLQARAETARGERDKDGVVPITITVTEGAVFTIGAIKMGKLGLPAADAKAIVAAMKSRPGAVFNRTVFRADLESVRKAVAGRGAKGTVEPLVTVDPKKKTIDVELELQGGS